MSQAPLPSESDRIALIQMFKAIAEYGRRVRQRRATEAAEERIEQAECNQASESPDPVQQASA